MRALDQREPLVDPRRAVDDRVAERIQRLRVVRLQLDEPLEPRLRLVHLVELFRDHREVVDQIRCVGMIFEALRQHAIRAGIVASVAQHLRLSLPYLDPLLLRDGGQVREPALRLVDAAELPVHRADAQLREPCAIAFGHRAIGFDRLRVLLRILGDLREVEVDRARLAIVDALEIAQQPLGFGVVLHLQRDRGHREFEIA